MLIGDVVQSVELRNAADKTTAKTLMEGGTEGKTRRSSKTKRSLGRGELERCGGKAGGNEGKQEEESLLNRSTNWFDIY